MLERNQLAVELSKYLLEPYLGATIKAIRPSIYLTPIENNSIHTNVLSKFGGYPDLPQHLLWPQNSYGKPYNFICQINWKEVKIGDSFTNLPNQGIVYFFTAPEDAQKVRVLYSKNDNDLSTVIPPKQKKTSFWKDIFKPKMYFKIFNSRKIHPSLVLTFPNYDSIFYEKTKRKFNTNIAPVESILDEGYFDDLLSKYQNVNVPMHSMTGYYHGIQNSHLETSLEDGRYRHLDRLSDEELDSYSKWELLLKIDSDERLGFNWAGNGSLLFFIKKSDLETGDFSGVKGIIDVS